MVFYFMEYDVQDTYNFLDNTIYYGFWCQRKSFILSCFGIKIITIRNNGSDIIIQSHCVMNNKRMINWLLPFKGNREYLFFFVKLNFLTLINYFRFRNLDKFTQYLYF